MHPKSQTHIIHKQLLDLHIGDQTKAKEWQNEISEYYKKEILPALEKACDEMITPDRHIRIDKIELDMGMVKNGDLRPELAAKLVRKFKEEILNTSYDRLRLVTEEISDTIHIPSGVVASPEKDRTTFDTLVYYIENGVLPWWCSSKDINLREGVKELWESASDQFIQKVRKLSIHSRICLRIVHLLRKNNFLIVSIRKGNLG